MNILENIAKSHQAVQTIENQLFNVVKMPLYTGLDDMYQIKNGYGLFKENVVGEQLGIAGKDFNSAQPKAIFEAFCDASLQSGFDIDKLKYFEMKEGKKIRFSIPIAKVSFTNIRGVEDTTEVILNVQTGYDGQTATSLYLETYRLICTNGMKKTFTEFKAKFRNTNGNEGKIAGLLADVTKCVGQVEKLEEMYIRLNSVKVNQSAVDKYIQSVFGYDLSKYADLGKQSMAIVDKVKECIEWEFNESGATAFGLFNGITHYTNHFAKGHENSDYLFTEQGARTNDKALKQILVMVK